MEFRHSRDWIIYSPETGRDQGQYAYHVEFADDSNAQTSRMSCPLRRVRLESSLKFRGREAFGREVL